MKELFNSIISGDMKHIKTGNSIRIDQMMVYFKWYMPEVYDTVKISGLSGSNYIFNVINDIIDVPKCWCGNDTKFKTLVKGYSDFCSNKCQVNHLHDEYDKNGYPFKRQTVLDQMKLNNIDKYGVEYPFQSMEYQRMMEEKYEAKTGFKKPSQTKEVANKIAISSQKYFASIESEPITGVVYVLSFTSGVKIGYSKTLRTRILSLKKDFGDFEILNIFESTDCRKLESQLHLKYDKYRMCLDEGNGRTEFFDNRILKEF